MSKSKLNKELAEIGRAMDDRIKELDALYAKARELIGFRDKKSDGVVEWMITKEFQGLVITTQSAAMRKILPVYASENLQRWEREEKVMLFKAEIERLGITQKMLFDGHPSA